MQVAKVIGDVVATHKDENLASVKLLVLQPIGADGRPVGRTLVAVDSVGAGVGETVFFVRGKEASYPFHPVEVPTDAGIVGISRSAAAAASAPVAMVRQHASHALFTLPAGSDIEGPCLIEPTVMCNHCGYCKSMGH